MISGFPSDTAIEIPNRTEWMEQMDALTLSSRVRMAKFIQELAENNKTILLPTQEDFMNSVRQLPTPNAYTIDDEKVKQKIFSVLLVPLSSSTYFSRLKKTNP